MDMNKQVIFKIGNEEFGIDINSVNGIEKYSNIVSVPNSPSYIEGIINLRGDVIPILNLREKFGMPKTVSNENTKIIIVRSKSIFIGIKVDVVNEILEFENDNLFEPPIIIKTSQTEYMNKVACLNHDRIIILLNLDGILSETEKKDIEQMLKDN